MTRTLTGGELRELVLERCQGYSELSGLPLDSSWELHHRRGGGMGGDSHPRRQSVCNVVALLAAEHNMHPDSVHMRPRWARERGLILPRVPGPDGDPLLVPALIAGRWRWLTLEGGYSG